MVWENGIIKAVEIEEYKTSQVKKGLQSQGER